MTARESTTQRAIQGGYSGGGEVLDLPPPGGRAGQREVEFSCPEQRFDVGACTHFAFSSPDRRV
jgi:hypothetical protein